MDCNPVRENLAADMEDCAGKDEKRLIREHLPQCTACREEANQIAGIRAQLFAAASAFPMTDLQDRIMQRISIAARYPAASHPRPGIADAFRHILFNRRILTVTAAIVVLAAAVAGWLALYTPPPVWAINQSIEALRGFRGVHITGFLNGGQHLELWIRSAPDSSQVSDLMARMENMTCWIKGNQTYYYLRGGDAVYVDDAQTAGFYPWPGPELLEFARAAGFREISHGLDAVTGHQRVAIETNLTTHTGLQSIVMEFDTITKLLVGMRQWQNPDRSGKPNFEVDTIEYSEDLSDDVFAVRLPAGIAYRRKDVAIPEELLGLLAAQQYGISAKGMTESDAAQSIVAAAIEAAKAQDWPRLRQLFPLAAGMSDQMLQALCNGATGELAITEILDISEGSRRGASRLGPVVVVPTRVRCRDGNIYEEKYAIQFRGPSDALSCVMFAAYGPPYRLK